MTPGNRQPKTIILLLLLVISFAGVFSAPVGQKPDRERRADTAPSPSPKPVPSPEPTPNSRRTENDAQAPQPSPSPQAKAPSSTRALSELQARITEVLRTPALG